MTATIATTLVTATRSSMCGYVACVINLSLFVSFAQLVTSSDMNFIMIGLLFRETLDRFVFV